MTTAERLRQIKETTEAAFRLAAETVVLRAHATGTKIVTWKDGRVVHVDPWDTEVGNEMLVKKAAGELRNAIGGR